MWLSGRCLPNQGPSPNLLILLKRRRVRRRWEEERKRRERQTEGERRKNKNIVRKGLNVIKSTYNPRLRQKDSEFKTSLSYNKTLLYTLTNKYITRDRSKDN